MVVFGSQGHQASNNQTPFFFSGRIAGECVVSRNFKPIRPVEPPSQQFVRGLKPSTYFNHPKLCRMKFMKKKALVVYFFWSCLSVSIVGGQERSGRTQTTESPETLSRRALELRKHDHSEQALATCEKAISEAPNSLRAHAEYVRTSAYDLERFDRVRAAYESQIVKEPNNPIYPLALAIGQDLTPLSAKRPWFEKVIAIAPDSSAAHLARSFLIYEKEPAPALSELSKFIEADGSIMQAYVQSILLEEKRLGDIDGAIATAQKWAARDDIAVSDFRGSGLFELWRLRLAEGQVTPSTRAALDDA